MRKRGFVFIHADQRGTKLWQYGWNARDNLCARAAPVDGRASSIGDHSGLASYVPLNSLVGARAQSLDNDMDKRGFVHRGGWQSGNAAFSIWWNAGTRQCIQGVVSDGRIQSLNPIVEGNCI
jgi:hypothetical protein